MSEPLISGKIFPSMGDGRFPVIIPVQPWFGDHHLGGRVILAAVETMLLLASKTVELFPKMEIRVMEDVFFAKFCEIPFGTKELATLVELAQASERIEAKLLSRVQFKTMSRLKEHGAVSFFSVENIELAEPVQQPTWATPSAEHDMEIKAETLYRDLVPFGPSYQTLQGSLFLSKDMAWGIVKASDVDFVDPVQNILGSPFPLDGAMHAACVLGQQLVDFSPFPVGFKRRTVFRPTQPGSHYQIMVRLISDMAEETEELVFDLDIYREKDIYEQVTGLRMRNVGGV
ncbi:MAG: hypothetical protein GY702_03785 [Desulfobulbaceae bacterium]|nr:hypothetical protein [Desulfobulbaceae bacterium]